MSPSFRSVLLAGPFFVICATYIPLSKSTFEFQFVVEFRYGITSLSYAYIPIVASWKLPVVLKLSIIGFTIFIGIANPIPSAELIFTVFIPITSPSGYIKVPPLFPRIYSCICLY